jgi:hypothetical protein
MSNTVTVACNLPRGIICELGLELNYQLAQFVKTPAYKAVRLYGSQRATTIALPPGSHYIPRRDLPPGLTPDVDREFITEWLKQHPKLAQHVWIVESTKDVPHQVGDRPKPPFEPLDRNAKFKVEANEIGPAKFDE